VSLYFVSYWGDSCAYDVGIEHGRHFLRVQVKSTSYRLGNGYLCAFTPNRHGARYTTQPPAQTNSIADCCAHDLWPHS
jgi:hypothetical protein